MKPEAFIAKIGPAALASAKATKIPASFTIAQAALESGWGESKTTRSANNLFNVKADASWRGPLWSMASTEHVNGKDVVLPAQWRVYEDWQACIDDHAAFFAQNRRYAKCFLETTGEGWARAVAAAGYATDPDYAAKLIATMRSHNLTALDAMPDEVNPAQVSSPVVTPVPAPVAEPEQLKPSILSAALGLFKSIFGKKG